MTDPLSSFPIDRPPTPYPISFRIHHNEALAALPFNDFIVGYQSQIDTCEDVKDQGDKRIEALAALLEKIDQVTQEDKEELSLDCLEQILEALWVWWGPDEETCLEGYVPEKMQADLVESVDHLSLIGDELYGFRFHQFALKRVQEIKRSLGMEPADPDLVSSLPEIARDLTGRDLTDFNINPTRLLALTQSAYEKAIGTLEQHSGSLRPTRVAISKAHSDTSTRIELKNTDLSCFRDMIALLEKGDGTLETLSLVNCRLSPPSLHALKLKLQESPSLRTLEIHHCALASFDARRIFEALCFPDCTLETLDLSHNAIGPDGLAFLCDVIEENQSLHHINLSFNNILHDRDFIEEFIEEAEASHPKLQILDLSNQSPTN